MCPSDLQQLWKDVSGVPSSEEALKQAEGLDLSTNSSNSTSAFPKAASAHLPLHSLPNGQSHTPKRDRYSDVETSITSWYHSLFSVWLSSGLSYLVVLTVSFFFLNLNLVLDTQKKTGTKHAHSAYHTSVWRKLRSAHLIGGVSATCQNGTDTKLGKKTRQ